MATPFETFLNTEIPQRSTYLTVDNTGYSGNPNLAVNQKINDAPKGTWFLNDDDSTLWYKRIKTDPASWEKVLGATGTISFLANCLGTDSVGDAVYITGNKIGDYYQVTKVDIDNTDSKKAIAIGVIVSKPSALVCDVQTYGPAVGVLSGLTPGVPLFTDVDGSLREGPPARPGSGRRVWQSIASIIASDAFIVNIGRPVWVR